MTENSAIFNARHGGGSFHPYRQPAPTAQDCLKRGTGANGERPGSYLVNVGFKGFNVANHNREELGERGPSLISSVDALINFTTRFRVEQLSQPCQYRVQYLDIFPPVCDREDCGLIGSAINT